MRFTASLAVASVLVLAACTGELPEGEPNPAIRTATLPTLTPPPTTFPGETWQRERQGDWTELDATLERTGSTCVAVVKDGELVHDAYWNGGSERGRHRVYSITKSLTSLLVGMAADAGALALDDPASEWVDEWQTGPAAEITVADLLSMTSGRRWDEVSDRRMIRAATDKTAHAVGMAQDSAPGKRWVYDNSAVQTLESVLDDVTSNDDVADIARARLLEPLGMRDTAWARDASGNALTFSGVESTCLDLARVGHLMLNRGAWDGEQLVSPGFVEQATRPSSELNAAYGLLWWVNGKGRVVEVLRQAGYDTDKPPHEGRLAPGVPDDAFWAYGYGDQYVAVVPSEGVVAVRLGARPATPDALTFDGFTRGVLQGLGAG
ncbi:serine hydrolase [Aeromicrobium sp. NPDC092404]|uniref:serine hydrolase domain-containing protein n=1 Tax=Aeromicrobium sp. NPDC092404 TaxID=3154976 RepID=UPI00342FAF1A